MLTIRPLITMDPAYAKPCAWCFGVKEFQEIGDDWRRAKELVQNHADIEVVVEGQYAGRNPGTTLKLALAAGNEVGLWGVHRDDIKVIPPQWKRGYPKPKRASLALYELYHVTKNVMSQRESAVWSNTINRQTREAVKLDYVDAVGLWFYMRNRLPKADRSIHV